MASLPTAPAQGKNSRARQDGSARAATATSLHRPPGRNNQSASGADEPVRASQSSGGDPRPTPPAGQLLIELTASPDGRRIDGVLRVAGQDHFVCVSHEPGTRWVRIWGHVAHIQSGTQAGLTQLPSRVAPSGACRWAYHPELDGLLTLEIRCPKRGHLVLLVLTDTLARGFVMAMQDQRVVAFLQHTRAKLCVRPTVLWAE